MTTEAPLAGLTAYERLVYHVVPALLSSCGCHGARNDLEQVLRSKESTQDNLVDALDAASNSAVHTAVHQGDAGATVTEQVAMLLTHIAEHEALEGTSSVASARHLDRAITIAGKLGHLVGPVKVVSA